MRRFLPVFSILAVLSLPFVTFAQGEPGWSIIPNVADGNQNLQTCAAGWKAVLVVAGGLMNFVVYAGVAIATIMAIYAGLLFLFNSTNPENLSKGRKILTNAAIGLTLALGAWIIVNTILKELGAGDVASLTSVLGTGGDLCIETRVLTPGTAIGGGGGVDTGGGGAGPGTPSTRGQCTPSALAGAGWPSHLANKMSCVTRYENAACDASAPSGTDIGKDGNSVSFGLFQINISANDMNYQACRATNGGAALNCTSAFGGGAYTGRNHNTYVTNMDLYRKCVAAASNPACNVQGAIEIYNRQGIGAWGTAAQNSCRGL